MSESDARCAKAKCGGPGTNRSEPASEVGAPTRSSRTPPTAPEIVQRLMAVAPEAVPHLDRHPGGTGVAARGGAGNRLREVHDSPRRPVRRRLAGPPAASAAHSGRISASSTPAPLSIRRAGCSRTSRTSTTVQDQVQRNPDRPGGMPPATRPDTVNPLYFFAFCVAQSLAARHPSP